MSHHEVWAASCSGKERYVNGALAHKAKARRLKSGMKIEVYLCRFCGGYHHAASRKKPK